MKILALLLLSSFLLFGQASVNGISGQTPVVASPLNIAQVNTQQLGKIFYADGFPSSCTVSGTGYTTQADCAYFTARAASETANNTADLIFGSGTYNKCATWTEPNDQQFVGVNLIGSHLQGTYIQQVCSTPSSAMITKTAGSFFNTFRFTDIGFLAASNANSCADIWGIIQSEFRNLDCRNVISGSDHDWQFGQPGIFGVAGAQEVVIDHVFASSLEPPPCGPANVTATLSGGAVTGYTVVSGGCGFQTSDLTVMFKGYGLGDHPCTVAPTATATQSGGVITAVTGVTPGSGCTGTLDVQVWNVSQINYGIDFEGSDSSIRDAYLGVGKVAGLKVKGGNNTVYHAHPTNIVIGIQDFANNDYEGTECDSLTAYCIDFQSSAGFGSIVNGTNSFTQISPQGYSTYHFAASNSGHGNVSFGPQGNLCQNGVLLADYHMIVSASGPIDTSISNLPLGVTLYGNPAGCGTGGDITSPAILNNPEFKGIIFVDDHVQTNALSVAALSTLGGAVNFGSSPGGSIDAFGRVQFPQSVDVAIGSSVASSANPVHFGGGTIHITGTSTIVNFDDGWVSSTFGACHVAIADAAWSTNTTGNIATTMTAVSGTMYSVCYDGSKWYVK